VPFSHTQFFEREFSHASMYSLSFIGIKDKSTSA